GGRAIEAALAQEVATRARLVTCQSSRVERLSHTMSVDEALALPQRRAGASSTGLIAERDARLVREVFDGLCERQTVHAHDELDDVATFATAKAVPAAHRGAHREGGAALVVEGAQALERAYPR